MRKLLLFAIVIITFVLGYQCGYECAIDDTNRNLVYQISINQEKLYHYIFTLKELRLKINNGAE